MTKEIDFEDALARIEVIAGRLNSGDIKLKEALSLYKEGAKLSKICLSKLKEAESEIKTVNFPDEND